MFYLPCLFTFFYFFFILLLIFFFFFFFNDTATTEIYTLSLHALFRSSKYIFRIARLIQEKSRALAVVETMKDRKSTRLNSSHGYISYAVFCLKKKKKKKKIMNIKKT